jgi:hypothetical protein
MVSNYNADISWILDYTDNYIIYDRSDTDEWIKPFDPKKVIKVPNIGWDIYDKFTYIIDNYDNLPDVIIMVKGNIFFRYNAQEGDIPKYISKEEFDNLCNNETFTPLMRKNRKTRLPISFYSEDGMFNEKNNSWYLNTYPAKYFSSYNQFIKGFGMKIPKYLKFAPGSNYIVTKKDIHKHQKSFYEKLRRCIDYSTLPGEATIIERFMYIMWTHNSELKAEMLELKAKNPILILYQKIMASIIVKILRPIKNKVKLLIKKYFN